MNLFSRLIRYFGLINSKKNLLFIHIPKTGGTSLKHFFLENSGFVEFGSYKNLYLKFFGIPSSRSYISIPKFPQKGFVSFGHCWVQALREIGYISDDFIDSSFKFCVIRNPYKRTISLYNHLCYHKKVDTTFYTFLLNIKKYTAPIGIYDQVGLSLANPQSDWICNSDGGIFVDKLYKLENDGLQSCLADLGFLDVKLEKKRVSLISYSYEDLLKSSSSIDLINKIYERDFSLLGYEYL